MRAARPLSPMAGSPWPMKLTAPRAALLDAAPRDDEAVGEPEPAEPEPEAVELPLGEVAVEPALLAVVVALAAAEGGVPGLSTENG